MDRLQRFANWWLGQFRGQRAFGKVMWVAVPMLFMCCGLTMLSALVNPPDPEPTAAAIGELPPVLSDGLHPAAARSGLRRHPAPPVPGGGRRPASIRWQQRWGWLRGLIGDSQIEVEQGSGRGGLNCGFGTNIWNNRESNLAELLGPSGTKVSRW